MVPPENWVVNDFPGSPYKGVFGMTENNFTPNMNIQEDKYPGPIKEYVQLSFGQLEKIMNAKKISESPFSAKNADGVKLVAHTEINALKLRQIFYFFETSLGQKVVATATVGRISGDKFDVVFDEMLHSFLVK